MNALANGVVGGITSVLGGGKFGNGFVSAGLVRLPNRAFESPLALVKARCADSVLARAVIGGTLSEATGGKFANGAATAAFSQLFNDEQALSHS